MERIHKLNQDIVNSHSENIKNNIFNNLNIPHLLFTDGEVVTEDDRGEYWTQIPQCFYNNDSFLFFVVNDKSVKYVKLTMDQAYKYREEIKKLNNELFR